MYNEYFLQHALVSASVSGGDSGLISNSSAGSGSIKKLIETLAVPLCASVRYDIAVFIFNISGKPVIFCLQQEPLSHTVYEDFLTYCYATHCRQFPDFSPEKCTAHTAGSGDGISESESAKISSYTHTVLTSPSGKIFGTVHAGSSVNHYWTRQGRQEKFTEISKSIGFLLYRYVAKVEYESQRKSLYNVLEKFLPRPIIVKMLSEGANDVKGTLTDCCVLFSDIRSFTSITEKNSAEDVVGFLNRYFNLMVSAIRSCGGIIDKFIGDAIVAVFLPDNVPKNGNPALSAYDAAIEMIKKLPAVDIHGMWFPPEGLRTGIGLHREPSVIGTVGSSEKKAFTVMGNSVRIAEKLESATKKLHTPLLFTESVQRSIHTVRNTRHAGEIDDGAARFSVFTFA